MEDEAKAIAVEAEPVVEAAPEQPPVPPEAPAVAAENPEEPKKYNFSKGLIPGDGNAEGSSPGDWRPCGLADGVIYFDNVEMYDSEMKALKVVKGRAGKERQALRYLLGPAALDSFPQNTPEHKRVGQAAEWVMMHPGSLGICEPAIDFLLNRHPEIVRESQDKGFPLNRKFLSSRAGLNANQPEHVKHWVVVAVPDEEGVWCVFYV